MPCWRNYASVLRNFGTRIRLRSEEICLRCRHKTKNSSYLTSTILLQLSDDLCFCFSSRILWSNLQKTCKQEDKLYVFLFGWSTQLYILLDTKKSSLLGLSCNWKQFKTWFNYNYFWLSPFLPPNALWILCQAQNHWCWQVMMSLVTFFFMWNNNFIRSMTTAAVRHFQWL